MYLLSDERYIMGTVQIMGTSKGIDRDYFVVLLRSHKHDMQKRRGIQVLFRAPQENQNNFDTHLEQFNKTVIWQNTRGVTTKLRTLRYHYF